ncbi:MAG TPA: ribose-5-phosphate isomerase RpiA [Acetobacteraceae bacterium]|nr:ribose-5-phosphate isomerase RpiA [Acetobacteraceae bacterium]
MTETRTADIGKRAAAEAAVSLVRDGMMLGLGTGSTVAFVLEALARRIRAEGLTVAGVPTSEQTASRATALGIGLIDLASVAELDLAIDGADEVEEGSLCLIKGHGGALLREKIVATAARRFVVVVDESKVVARLGTRMSIPVEVVRFAHAATARRLERLAAPAVLRPGPDGAPFITDNGNLIYDLGSPGKSAEPIADPRALECDFNAIVGVVESGLFTHGVERAIVGDARGAVRTLTRQA